MNDSGYSIADFMFAYPDNDDPKLVSKITSMTEFKELSSGKLQGEKIEGYFPHQMLAARLMQFLDKLLIIDDPGTGKSCLITCVMELLKERQNVKNVIILVPTKALELNLLTQIIEKCTSGKYMNDDIRYARIYKDKRAAMKSALQGVCEIMTYYDFTKKIIGFKLQSELDDFISDTAILCDEFHYIYRSKDTKLKDIDPDEEDDPNIRSQKYPICHRAFHSGSRVRITAVTGTPIKSRIDELPYILNMLLPMDNQMPKFTMEELELMTYDDIKQWLSGYIFYTRAPDNGLDVEYVGSEIEGFHTKIDLYPMSDFQYKQYLKVKEQGEHRGEKSFYHNETTVSYMVYPDGSFSQDGARQYMETAQRNYTYRNDAKGRLIKSYYEDLDRLTILSAKSVGIIQLYLDAWADPELYPDFEVPMDKGIIFTFFPDHVWGSGLFDYATQMEEQGYEIFRDTRKVIGEPIGRDASGNLIRNIRLTKKKRIAIITGNTSTSELNNILELCNSYENRYGQYLQGIFGSKSAKEGLNIFNAIAMIKAGPSWFWSEDYQSTYRVIRADSHVHRLREIRQFSGNPDARFKINIHNMAAYHEDDIQTIDVEKFIKLERDITSISKAIRWMKMSAVSCLLNYDRNVRIGIDKDYSMQCDYQVCAYKCSGCDEEILAQTDDRSKYLLYYHQDRDKVISKLTDVFSYHSSAQINNLISISGLDPIYVYIALDYMMKNKIAIRDRYGQSGFLNMSSDNIVYIQKEPFLTNNYADMAYYDNMLIFSLDPKQDLLKSWYDNYILSHFDKNWLGDDFNIKWIKKMKTLPNIIQVKLFEQIWLGVQFGNASIYENKFYRKLAQEYEGSFFIMDEPIGKIEDMETILSGRGKGRGRKPKDETVRVRTRFLRRRTLELKEESDQIGDPVMIHKLIHNPVISYQNTQEYLYSRTRIRVLRIKEQKWRDATEAEYVVYSDIIKGNIIEYQSYYENLPFYGIMLDDKLFIKDSDINKDAVADKTKLNKGASCDKSMPKEKLIDYMWKMKVIAPPAPYKNRAEHLNVVRQKKYPNPETLSDEKLYYAYSWYYNKIKRRDICPIMKDTFMERGMLFDGGKPKLYDQYMAIDPDRRNEFVISTTELDFNV
jgi:hypothetical protein